MNDHLFFVSVHSAVTRYIDNDRDMWLLSEYRDDWFDLVAYSGAWSVWYTHGQGVFSSRNIRARYGPIPQGRKGAPMVLKVDDNVG